MIPRIIVCCCLICTGLLAADGVAAKLARQARDAQQQGQIVKAYLLWAQAAARDPQNTLYRNSRDSLASAAHLLASADVQQTADIADAVAAAEVDETGKPKPSPIERTKQEIWEHDDSLKPLPRLQFSPGPKSFDVKGDGKTVFEHVCNAFGVRVTFDPQFTLPKDLHFVLDEADFRTSMEAVTAVTGSFMFPISEHEMFVAQDTEQRRNEYEPNVLLSFPLPNALKDQDLVEAVNAVRGLFILRSIGWDAANRMVLIRDRYTRARVARSVLQSLLLPRGQLSVEVEFLAVDTEKAYHYGFALPTSAQLIYLGQMGGFHNIISSAINLASFAAFGGGATLFGVSVANANIFATYTTSYSQSIFDTTLIVGDGQTASLHIGDKYPIPQSLYTGFNNGQNSASLYNPIGTVTLEDLGILLKLTPRINGEEEIAFDLEAQDRALGTQTFNTVPAILERTFKGNVTLKQGEWAVIAGLHAHSNRVTRTGIPGLADIPGINHVFAENTRDDQTNNTLIVIKPTITALPMSSDISPQFLVGPLRGERVLM